MPLHNSSSIEPPICCHVLIRSWTLCRGSVGSAKRARHAESTRYRLRASRASMHCATVDVKRFGRQPAIPRGWGCASGTFHAVVLGAYVRRRLRQPRAVLEIHCSAGAWHHNNYMVNDSEKVVSREAVVVGRARVQTSRNARAQCIAM